MGKKEKKPFKMPHLLWIMFGIIVLACLATYLIPAGEFAVNEAGQITGTDFHFLGHQTPVSPWGALMRVKSGMVGAATIAFVVMISGANINVVLETGVMDDLMNWGVYKLKDKGTGILVSMMMILMAYLGGFGGTDALIAVVPVGVMFSKKLKLDPICALAVTTFAALVGFGTGPAQQATTQMLMGVTPYSGFFTRLVIMNFFLLVAIIMTMQYIKKIRKNPAASIMYQDGWRPDAIVNGSEEELLKHVEMNWRKVAVIVLFVLQYLIIAIYPLMGGDSNLTFDFMLAVMIITMIVVGIIGGMSAEKLADAFAKGLGSMAFVAFVIGLAKVISLVLADGNVIQAAYESSKIRIQCRTYTDRFCYQPADPVCYFKGCDPGSYYEAGSRSTGLTSEPCSCSLSDGRQLYQPVIPAFRLDDRVLHYGGSAISKMV